MLQRNPKPETHEKFIIQNSFTMADGKSRDPITRSKGFWNKPFSSKQQAKSLCSS